MQDYNTIIGSIQMRLNGGQTRSVMDRYKIGSGTLNLIKFIGSDPTVIMNIIYMKNIEKDTGLWDNERNKFFVLNRFLRKTKQEEEERKCVVVVRN